MELQTLEQAHGGPDAAYYGERPDWLVAHVTNRDAETLTRANHQAIASRLELADPADWARETSGHWAVGWLESIVVRPGSEAHAIAQRAADELADYPVLDDEVYSDMEYEEAMENASFEYQYWYWAQRGADPPDAADVAPYIVEVVQDRGSSEYPTRRDVFAGVLDYRRAQRV